MVLTPRFVCPLGMNVKPAMDRVRKQVPIPPRVLLVPDMAKSECNKDFLVFNKPVLNVMERARSS